jgi:hypothetical protein
LQLRTLSRMRLRSLFFAFLGVALAWSAQAQVSPTDARDHYEAELGRQCPDKQLQMLSAGELRDGLDDYLGGLPSDVRTVFDKAQSDRCSSQDAGVGCVNLSDIATADDNGRLADLVQSVCTAFLRCRNEGVCDYAR